MYGRNPVTSKKEMLVTNVKVFQTLTVVAKRFPLDVAGVLSSAGIRKAFTSVAGFLNLTGFLNPPVLGFLNPAGIQKSFTSISGPP